MKSIGFVDFYISEWHANNYPAWISAAAKKLNMDVELKYVWAEEYVSPVDGRNTDEWCAEFGAERCLLNKTMAMQNNATIKPKKPEIVLSLNNTNITLFAPESIAHNTTKHAKWVVKFINFLIVKTYLSL